MLPKYWQGKFNCAIDTEQCYPYTDKVKFNCAIDTEQCYTYTDKVKFNCAIDTEQCNATHNLTRLSSIVP